MKRALVTILVFLIGNVGQPAFAHVETAIHAMTVIARASSGKSRATPASNEQAYFSSGLLRYLRSLPKQKSDDPGFDADEITGSQEPDEMTVKSAIGHGNTVTINYVYGGTQPQRVDYIMVNEGGVWKIDDVIYFSRGKVGSYRTIMKRILTQ